MSTMTYQEYRAVIEYDDEAELFHGEVTNLRDVVVFQGTSVNELKQAFADSIADYLAFCEERGEAPNAVSGTKVRHDGPDEMPAAISPAEAEEEEPIWPTRAQEAFNVAQAKRLKEQVEAGGLRFEAHLTSREASWLLGLVESKVFIDPADAVAVLVQEARELHPHKDLREELLRRMIQASIDDPRPSIPAEEVFAELEKRFSQPLPVPAEWERYRHEE